MNTNHQNLQLSNKMVKEILNVIPNPVFVWQKKEEDLVLVDFNKAAEVITDFKVKNFISLKATEFYHDRLDIIKDINRCLNKKLTFSKEMRYRFISTSKYKTLYVTYSHISPDLVIVYIDDITKQKKAEVSLKKSETEKSIILESISELIVFQDGENNIIRANKAAADSVQMDLEQLIGQKCYVIWHNRETPCEICPINRTVKTSQIETDAVTSPDGRNYIITGYPVFDNSDKLIGVVEVAKDVSAQRKSQQKIKESEEKYRLLFENMTAAFAYHEVITDENNKPIDYKYIEANPAFEKLTGLKLDDLIGKNVTEALPGIENDPADWIGRYGKVGLTGIPLIIEDYSEPLDRWYNVSGYSPKKGFFAVTFTDITERKKTEEKLKESEKKYRLLFENMAAAFAYHKIIVDENNKPIDYQFLEANPAFEEFTGLKIKDIIGKKVTEVLPGIEKDPADWIGKYGKVALTKIPLTFENYSEALDQWFSVAAYSPQEGYFAVTFTNITERKKAELALRKSRENYRDSYNRTNLYKDVFTHDINNILQNVLSSLELSKAFSYDINKKQEYREVTTLIDKQIGRGKKLVKNIQTLSQIESYKKELSSIEVLNILEKAVEFLKEGLPNKTINITIIASQDEYYIRADKFLRQIFNNILDNAVYHNQNSLIEIIINVSRESKNDSDFIKFEFIDNGLGIPDPMKKTIFHREITEDNIPSGIGLGLLLVRRILERYSGEIRVEDRIIGEHSKGSKFIILIQEKPNNL